MNCDIYPISAVWEFPNLNFMKLFFNRKFKQTTLIYFGQFVGGVACYIRSDINGIQKQYFLEDCNSLITEEQYETNELKRVSRINCQLHCVKSVRIRSYSGPYFTEFLFLRSVDFIYLFIYLFVYLFIYLFFYLLTLI